MAEVQTKILCDHCGDTCRNEDIRLDDKIFCCSGCLNVFQLLNENDLGDYYCLNERPGQKVEILSKEKFAFLDEPDVIKDLLSFSNSEQSQVSFYLPQMHCSSCLWLLENLLEINKNIFVSQVNFTQKILKVTYNHNELSLRQLAELLTYIGYEPVIDLYGEKKENNVYNSKRAYLKLGIVGFCMSNIMMISFPEYLGLDPASNPQLSTFFKMTNVALSLPVVLYGAREFFVNAFYSFRQRYLNIDAPIALAIAVTWLRSLYEVFTGTGAGFFDSMAGIVFFMLLGRTLQNRSYSTLRFNRDFKSYFPVAVAKLKSGLKEMVKLEEIKENDVLLIHHQEVIPTDCLLSKGNAKIDYSFVTGEDKAEFVDKGEVIYAGGRNVGETVEVVAVKSFNQNSFTQMWNSEAFHKTMSDKDSRITAISKYFSIVVLLISLGAFLFWKINGQSDVAWRAATAVLIIACPCALLLTANFTNGYLLSKLSKIGVYLKNASVIEAMANIDYIAFDKTGTLTEPEGRDVEVQYSNLTGKELAEVLSIVSQSLHPLSRAIAQHYQDRTIPIFRGELEEISGKGLKAIIHNKNYKIGSAEFVGSSRKNNAETAVYVSVNDEIKAKFLFRIALIPGTEKIIHKLNKNYELSLISGDNTSSVEQLAEVFGSPEKLHYRMKPDDKLDFVKEQQTKDHRVMMIGDGLNDAGALKQSDVGVSVVKSAFAFSPSCDVIMNISRLRYLPEFLSFAKGAQKWINIGFAYSLVFNVIGLGFALTGKLSPLAAAVIMPSSSLGIILIAWAGISFMVKNGHVKY